MKVVAIALITLLPAVARAQTPNLAEILSEHRAAIEKAARSDDGADYDKAVARFCAVLETHLREAEGSERHRTRFELVHAFLAAGKRDEAKRTLRAFDVASASCVDCGQAAMLANTIGLAKEAESFIAAGLRKHTSTGDRMEFGVLLVSALRKPKAGLALFDAAFAAAKTDAARAAVLWHRARGTREREDLSAGAYEKELLELAKRYPKTRYGAIAGDRLRAMDFKVGGEPLPFKIATLGGGSFELANQHGRVVLLCFWHSDDPRSTAAVAALQKLHEQHGSSGLVVLGISVDEQPAEARAAAKRFGSTFLQAHAAGGFESDLALRYRIEDVPHAFLVGRDGKLRGMNFVFSDEEGLKQVADAVGKALDARAGGAKDTGTRK